MRDQAQAFEEHYSANYHKIRSFCHYYLRDAEKADSVVQDLFISIWEKRDSLVFDDTLLPYLFVSAKNRCINLLKREITERKYLEDGNSLNRDKLNLGSLQSSSAESLYCKEVSKLLAKTLDKMPQTVRSTFELSRFNNLNYNEIAKEQNISKKTVEYRIMYALRVLRKAFKDYLPILLKFITFS